MQCLFGLVGLLVFLVSSETVSEPALKTMLVLYGERGDLPVIRAIEQNIRETFHASASPEIEWFSEYCGCACVLLRSCLISFPVLCR